MTALAKREPRPLAMFDRFDRMFDEWSKHLTSRWPMTIGGEWPTDQVIRVDEFRENGTLVIRAEMPGMDPDKDVSVTMSDGMLQIKAERHEEEETEDRGYMRRELRYGSFVRTLPLPEGMSESDVKATYTNGMLEIRVPAPEPTPAKKIEITTS
jgi:HSP20 family protein